MTVYNWRDFLQRASDKLIFRTMTNRFYEEDDLEPEVIESRWLGYPGATEEQLTALETRLQKKLPPSYRQFLQVTNGWRDCFGYPNGLTELWSTDEVDWFADKGDKYIGRIEGYGKQREWLIQNPTRNNAFHPYLNYEYQSGWHDAPLEYFEACLGIGDFDGNECCLLNPCVINEDGEWEAWHYTIEDGIFRYPSFWLMMTEDFDFMIDSVGESIPASKD